MLVYLALGVCALAAIVTEDKVRGFHFASDVVTRRYAALTLLCAVSVLYSDNRASAILVVVRMGIALCTLAIFARFFRSKNEILRATKLFVIATTAYLAYIIYHHDFQTPVFSAGGVNTISYIALAGVALVLFLWSSGYRLFGLALPVCLFALVLTTSQKTNIAAFVMMVVLVLAYLLRRSSLHSMLRSLSLVAFLTGVSWWVWHLPVLEWATGRTSRRVTVTAMAIAGEDWHEGAHDVLFRESLIADGLRYYLQSPLIGYGINGFRELNGRETGQFTYSHNTPIELLVGVGPLGLFLYYGILYAAMRRLWPRRNARDYQIRVLFLATLLAFVIIGMGQDMYYNEFLAFLLSVTVGFSRFGPMAREAAVPTRPRTRVNGGSLHSRHVPWAQVGLSLDCGNGRMARS